MLGGRLPHRRGLPGLRKSLWRDVKLAQEAGTVPDRSFHSSALHGEEVGQAGKSNGARM